MRSTLRFSVSGLLGATTSIAIVVCGWIHWPAMTASSFVANSNIDPSTIVVPFNSIDERIHWTQAFAKNAQRLKCQLKPRTRSTMDILLGTQEFDYGPYDISVRRGKISVDGPYWDFGAGKMRR